MFAFTCDKRPAIRSKRAIISGSKPMEIGCSDAARSTVRVCPLTRVSVEDHLGHDRC
jgi:hypothetical protein